MQRPRTYGPTVEIAIRLRRISANRLQLNVTPFSVVLNTYGTSRDIPNIAHNLRYYEADGSDRFLNRAPHCTLRLAANRFPMA